MQLKLKLSGSVKPFSNYLKNFSKIRTSLLLEIDTEHKAFVAKTYTEDKGAIRFSAIPFEECNIDVVSDDFKGNRESRVKLGMVSKLPRFIKMIERMGEDTGKDGKSEFFITVEYMETEEKDGKDYVATKTVLYSNNLSMKMDGYRTNEFRYLTDETFNKTVFRVDEGCEFDMSNETLSSIISTSDIFADDPKKDGLVFYVEGKKVSVMERVSQENGQTPNFTMFVSEAYEECSDTYRTPIYRSKFIDILKGSDDDYKVKIGYVTGSNGVKSARILFDSKNTMTRVVIASIMEA